MTSELQKMLAGDLYDPGDAELVALRKTAQKRMQAYNATVYGDETRSELLTALLGSVGADCALRAPLYVDYGCHIHFGDNVFMNYGCVLLDVCPINIGARTAIGPYAQILTADHPRDAAGRSTGLENGQPVTIGQDVWIGGGAIILPGVTIGNGAVVGAGAVVTRDVPADTTVAGNPARPLVPKTDQP